MKNRIILFAIILFTLMGLVACQSVELEENCFPMVVLVGEEEGKVTYEISFPKATSSSKSAQSNSDVQVPPTKEANFEVSKSTYESHLSQKADYNHLKVLVLEDEVLENQKIYLDMLTYLAQNESFPRNTYVCVVDDIEDMLKLEKTIAQELGTYLEEFLKNQEPSKARLLTLGDLLNEKENQMMVLYLPYLEVEEKYVEWNGFVNTVGKKWQESD